MLEAHPTSLAGKARKMAQGTAIIRCPVETIRMVQEAEAFARNHETTPVPPLAKLPPCYLRVGACPYCECKMRHATSMDPKQLNTTAGRWVGRRGRGRGGRRGGYKDIIHLATMPKTLAFTAFFASLKNMLHKELLTFWRKTVSDWRPCLWRTFPRGLHKTALLFKDL